MYQLYHSQDYFPKIHLFNKSIFLIKSSASILAIYLPFETPIPRFNASAKFCFFIYNFKINFFKFMNNINSIVIDLLSTIINSKFL